LLTPTEDRLITPTGDRFANSYRRLFC